MINISVVILAGGLATRLRPITEKIPKSLILINETPFVIHQLSLLYKKGINNVHFCLGYLGNEIEKIVQKSSFSNKMKITYSYDGKILLGTGGAIKNAFSYISEDFLIIYGDSYLDIDYKSVLNFFQKKSNTKNGLMTIYKNENKFDKSNIVFKQNKIINYSKKEITSDMNYIDFGLGILRKNHFDLYEKNQTFDLSNVYQDLVKQNELLGFESKNRFYEIGSMDGIKDLSEYLNKN
tara:strand:+ start:160 stop:870 length:711 start_codon:yes stop_codon:yes gene_type:complete